MVSAEIFNGKEFALIVVSCNLWEFIWCDEWVKNILFLAKGIEKLTSLVYNITNIIRVVSETHPQNEKTLVAKL